MILTPDEEATDKSVEIILDRLSRRNDPRLPEIQLELEEIASREFVYGESRPKAIIDSCKAMVQVFERFPEVYKEFERTYSQFLNELTARNTEACSCSIDSMMGYLEDGKDPRARYLRNEFGDVKKDSERDEVARAIWKFVETEKSFGDLYLRLINGEFE
jgi:hypothetical protein